jgi:hypothetical protein
MGDSIQTVKELAMQANARVDTHEAVCAERYEKLDYRLQSGAAKMTELKDGQKSIMRVMLWGGGVMLTTLIALTGWLGNRLADTVLK